MDSRPSSAGPDSEGARPRRGGARDSLVPAFYAALLLALLVVAVHGEAIHPLLAAALGVGLVFCWVSWPAYRETLRR